MQNVDEVADLPAGGQASGLDAPAVSVCIPLYMKERYVALAIQSVLDQTFTDFELVILNNASSDRSAEIAASFDDPRIKIFHNAETVPGPANFAKLVPLSRAPLVKLLSADDSLHPTVLERQVAVLQDPAIALVSCRQNMIGEHNEVIYGDRCLRTPDLIGRQSRTTVLRRVIRHVANPVGALPNVTFRRAAYDAAGGIPDAPFVLLDVAIWLNVLRFGDFYGMDETLVDFRIADGSASSGSGSAGLDAQVRYIRQLRRENAELLCRSDTTYGTLRTPLMRLRQGLIVSAAGPKDSVRTRAARKVLALSRGVSAQA